jgi:hypothetical protein
MCIRVILAHDSACSHKPYHHQQHAIRRRASQAIPWWAWRVYNMAAVHVWVGSGRGIHMHFCGALCNCQWFVWLRQPADWVYNRSRLSYIDKSVQTRRDNAVNAGLSKRPTQPLMTLLSHCGGVGGGGIFINYKITNQILFCIDKLFLNVSYKFIYV